MCTLLAWPQNKIQSSILSEAFGKKLLWFWGYILICSGIRGHTKHIRYCAEHSWVCHMQGKYYTCYTVFPVLENFKFKFFKVVAKFSLSSKIQLFITATLYCNLFCSWIKKLDLCLHSPVVFLLAAFYV